MGENRTLIDATTFVNMFLAISYLQEQRVFSPQAIFRFIDEYVLVPEEDVLLWDIEEEARAAIENMINDGVLEELPYFSYKYPPSDKNSFLDLSGNLYQITNMINYREIIEENKDKLYEMQKIFYEIYANDPHTISMRLSDNKQKK